MIRGRVSEKRHCSNAKGWRVRRSSAGQRAAQDAHMWQQAGHMIPQQGRRKSRVGTTEARKRDRVHRDRSFPPPSPPPPPAVHLPRIGGERAVSEHLAARRVFRRMRLSAGSESPSHFPYISSSRPLFGLACALCLVFFLRPPSSQSLFRRLPLCRFFLPIPWLSAHNSQSTNEWQKPRENSVCGAEKCQNEKRDFPFF